MPAGADPFGLHRGESPLPPVEGFDFGGGPTTSPSGRPLAGNQDAFTSRPAFGQPPSQPPFGQPPRGYPQTSDLYPDANRSQGMPPAGMQRPEGAETSGAWRPEQRVSHPVQRSAEGLSASSLVDKAAVPEWLREIDQGTSAPAWSARQHPISGPRPFETPQASGGIAKSAAPLAASDASSPFDAAALVDEAALPDWLRSSRETEPLPLPFMVSNSVSSLRLDGERGEKKAAESAGPADDDAVPDWLQQVYSDAHVPPLTEDRPPQSAGPKTISGSDLLDKRSVPTWLREAEQTSPLANIDDILAFTPPADQPEGWLAGAPRPAFPSASNANSGPLSGNSLIDTENMPEWLRNLGDGGGQGMPKDTSGSGFAAEAAQSSLPGFFTAAELVDTQALPSWLKAQGPAAAPELSPRPQGPSAPSGSASGIFAASELVDTAALPTWLKEQEPKTVKPSESFAAQEQSALLNSASGLYSANELIDTQALPTWLKAQAPQSGSTPEPSSGPPEQSPPLGSASGIFSASELVDTAALPVWLKGQEPGGAPPAGVTSGSGIFDLRPPTSKITPMPVGFSGQQTGAFSAAELVDTKALPAWLKSAGSESGQPTSQGGRTASSAEGGALMGSDLVDTGALPVWLRGAESSPGVSGYVSAPSFPSSTGPAPAGSSEQTGGFSAASLVDPEALPEWLRPAQSGGLSQNGGLPPSGGLPQSEGLPQSGGLTPHAASRSGSGVDWGQQDDSEQSGFSAASLIDRSELPEWMRTQEGLQRPGTPPPESATEEDTPQARVPRRPRLSTEPDRAPSQAAANVFSSVLGPTAGEEQRNPSSLGGRSAAAREMSGRGNPFGQLSAQAQAQGWDTPEPGGWDQSSLLPRQGDAPRGFDNGFDQGGAGDWSASYGGRSQGDDPFERSRPDYRALGPLSEGQRSRPPSFQPEEPEEVAGPPPRRPAGKPQANPGFGMADDQEPDSYGQRGFGEYPAGPQGRGYPQQYDGWEGGPDYDPGFAGDDEAGPPSGMFAKLKRMLGFGR